MANTTFDEVQPGVWVATNDDTNWSAGTDLVDSSERARRIDTLMACNNDTVDHNLGFYYHVGSANTHFGWVLVPAGAGTPTVPAVDCLAALLPTGSNGIVVPPAFTFGFAEYEAIASGHKVELVAIGGFLT